jgi:hypothetical protein
MGGEHAKQKNIAPCLPPLHLFCPQNLPYQTGTSKEEGILTFGVMIDTPEVCE